MKKTRLLSLLLAAAMLIALLAGCGGGGTAADDPATTPDAPPADTTAPDDTQTPPPADGPFDINVCFASEPETMDPNLNRSVDGAVMAHHAFEGLYKWVDDGTGNAVLEPGQIAGEPEKVTDEETGAVTYTYTLRDDIKWSDGQPVTAKDFEFSWKRLVTPDLAAPYSYMINMVRNANEAVAGEVDPSELGITAVDEKTLVVELTYDCPYFKEICAFPTCMPLREDIVTADETGWFRSPETYVCNGPYKMNEWVNNASITFVPNDQYYGGNDGPDSITFKLMDDNRAQLTAFKGGELDYMQNPPPDEIASLLASGDLIPGDYLGTYYACFNNAKAPFDNILVRKAFSLAIDRNYLVEQVTQVGEYPAGGWVPAACYDVDGPDGPDFRTVGGDYVSVDPADYEANCEEARALLAEAGYPNGEGFPAITYLYNTDDRHNAIAVALQQMWKEVLNVDVTLDNQDWNVFLQTRTAGEYSICRNSWIADFNDPMNFLDMFLTGGGNNDSHYASERYDALINEALVTADPQKRMDLMHQAEDIMIGEDAAIAPLFYYNQPYLISDRVNGMYYTPLGYFFFIHCTPAA